MSNSIKVLYSLIFIIFSTFSVAKELDEAGKKVMSIFFYAQTGGGSEKFITDIDNNITLKNLSQIKQGRNSKPVITVNNCFMTDFKEGTDSYRAFEKILGKDNKVLLLVSSVYKTQKIDYLRDITKLNIKKWLEENKLPFDKVDLGCKEDKSVYGPFISGHSIIVLPGYLVDATKASYHGKKFSKNYTPIFQLKYDTLVSLTAELQSKDQKSNDEISKIKSSYQDAKNKTSVGGLILSLPTNYGSSIKNLKTCTANYSGIDAQRVFGYRLLHKSVLNEGYLDFFNEKKLGFPKGIKFDKGFKDVNDAYLNLIDKNTDCAIYIDYAENVFKLNQALARKEINTVFTRTYSNQYLEDKYAVSKGYESANERNLIVEIGGSLKLAKELRKLKIDSIDKFNLLLAEIKQSGYADDPSVKTVSIYLSDKKNALSNGIGINEYKTQRVTKAKLAAENRRKDAKERKRKFAKEHPYEAVIKCGFSGSHTSLVACFSGGGKYGVDTSLEITNGSTYKMYKPYEIANSNFKDTSSGVIIPLKKTFNIKAQNASDALTLSVIVRDTLTKKTLFEKSAAKFGAIKISN
ncbi:hypothetical protein N9400_01945 [Candidatus Thioglobus sp.]|nr:hypothetical protein [Candidatus Thioglobus sp.]